MRTKKILIRIAVEEEVHKRLTKDKERFEKTLDGGRWSLSDTIKEYQKIVG